MIYPIANIEDAQTLSQAIVNTIAEPFLVLDERFRVLAASRSFYRSFKVDPEETLGTLLYDLGNGQWDIPALRLLLETIIPEKAAMDEFEVDDDFPNIGRRTMLLNARKVVYDRSSATTILLAFTDATARRAMEREKEELLSRTEELLRQKDVLLREMEHRVANSLQIIASILLLKARSVTSEETRQHLNEAHRRVLSVAEVQRHLHASTGIGEIEVGSYLSKLCASLSSSMIGDTQGIGISTKADAGRIDSQKAVSLGLIVTELVLNAIKHAFPAGRAGAFILVTYEIDGDDWKLTVSDNGIGKAGTGTEAPSPGLGTAIVEALVKQLNARIDAESGSAGTNIAVTRATFASRASRESRQSTSVGRR
jgi:two-component sensor histidine kinase